MALASVPEPVPSSRIVPWLAALQKAEQFRVGRVAVGCIVDRIGIVETQRVVLHVGESLTPVSKSPEIPESARALMQRNRTILKA